MTTPNMGDLERRACATIKKARDLYSSSDDDDGENTPEQLCTNALDILDGCDDGMYKSLLICEANIILFISILKRLRLKHVELDPLNSSDDLFAKPPPRLVFAPKPLEKLSPVDFRRGFDRLRSVHEAAYRVWSERIAPKYATTARQKQQIINVTCKLASISLLSESPFSALDPFWQMWNWLKTTTPLRWLIQVLVIFGFPQSALKVLDSPEALKLMEKMKTEPDRNGTDKIIEQVKRWAALCDNQDPTQTTTEGSLNDLKSISSRSRIESLISYVDIFAIQQIPPSRTNSIIAAISRSRQFAGNLFCNYNKMETCPVLQNLEDPQHFVDTFWYFHIVLQEALMNRRVGRIEMSNRVLHDGYNTVFVLCLPYWLQKFTINQAMLDALCKSDTAIDRQIFIRDIFMPDDFHLGPAHSTRGQTRGSAKQTICHDRSNSPVVESPRRDESDGDVLVETNVNAVSRVRSSVKKPPRVDANPAYCRCCIDQSSLDKEVFQSILPQITSTALKDGQNIQRRCLEILQSNIPKKRVKAEARCARHSSTNIPHLVEEETAAMINEQLWQLMDFYVLLSTVNKEGRILESDEITMVENLLKLLDTSDVSLFSVYYRLTFSLFVSKNNIERYLDANANRQDIVERFGNLRLDGKENTPTPRSRKPSGRQRKGSDELVLLKTAIDEVVENVQQHGYLQYYPWCRWSRQLMAILYMDSTPADIRLESDNSSTSIALNLLESVGNSFRQTVMAKDETSKNSELDAKMSGFENEKALIEALDKLPKDYTVISLHVVNVLSSRRLILCRLSSRYLPIVTDLGDVMDRFDAFEEFGIFVPEVEESVKVIDKKAYWARRHALEAKLEHLLARLETEWFGYRRVLVRGYSHSKWKEMEVKVDLLSKDNATLELAHISNGMEPDEWTNYIGDMLHSAEDVEFFEHRSFKYEPRDYGPVFLILDKDLYGLPWENIPVLRGKPVSRMPCLQYLLRSIALHRPPKSVVKESVHYVVNPGDDLQSTEDFFRWFSSINGWDGCFRIQPDYSKMKEMLENRDIHLYCGHNSGVRCLQISRRIELLSCKAAVVLMGCGSGRPIDRGSLYEPDMIPNHYMVANSPAVVSCLWSITCPDIDKYLADVLKTWLNVVDPTAKKSRRDDENDYANAHGSLANSIAQGKRACKLPLLTGGAVVLTGLPLFRK